MNLSKEQQKTLRGIAKTAHLRGFKNKDIEYRIVDRAPNYRGDIYKDENIKRYRQNCASTRI